MLVNLQTLKSRYESNTKIGYNYCNSKTTLAKDFITKKTPNKNPLNFLSKDSKNYVPFIRFAGINNQYSSNRISNKIVSFKGTSINHINDEMSENLYSEFLQKYKNLYGNIPINKIINLAIKYDNELGHGREKKVYFFPGIPEFLIGYLYQQQPHNEEYEIIKAPLELNKYNFGQPIATNGNDIIIKKFVNGHPHSLSNYHKILFDIMATGNAKRESALEYLNKLKLIKDFPQKSYNDFIKQFEYLYENVQPIDFINPNNILIDYENQKFNFIDVNDKSFKELFAEEFHGREKDIISAYDIITLLIDMKFQAYFLDQLNKEERQEVITISKDIIKKCTIATKQTKLYTKDDIMLEMMKLLASRTPNASENLYNRYDECKRLYQEELNQLTH